MEEKTIEQLEEKIKRNRQRLNPDKPLSTKDIFDMLIVVCDEIKKLKNKK